MSAKARPATPAEPMTTSAVRQAHPSASPGGRRLHGQKPWARMTTLGLIRPLPAAACWLPLAQTADIMRSRLLPGRLYAGCAQHPWRSGTSDRLVPPGASSISLFPPFPSFPSPCAARSPPACLCPQRQPVRTVPPRAPAAGVCFHRVALSPTANCSLAGCCTQRAAAPTSCWTLPRAWTAAPGVCCSSGLSAPRARCGRLVRGVLAPRPSCNRPCSVCGGKHSGRARGRPGFTPPVGSGSPLETPRITGMARSTPHPSPRGSHRPTALPSPVPGWLTLVSYEVLFLRAPGPSAPSFPVSVAVPVPERSMASARPAWFPGSAHTPMGLS